MCFQWSLRLRSLWKRRSATSQCQRWREKKDVFNILSLSTNQHSAQDKNKYEKNASCTDFFVFLTSVKIMELNLTHTDLQFVPGVGLLFGVQNSSISLSFHRKVLYWLLLVPTFLLFDFTLTSLFIWIFSMRWRKVEFFLFWYEQWSQRVTCVLCQLWHREHQRFSWRCEHQHRPEFDQRWWWQTEDKQPHVWCQNF